MAKGILLAGGLGSRLRPSTVGISKHLLPIYDKPMIYYSLSTLLFCGCKEILIISDERNIQLYKIQLSELEEIGLNISYKQQENPEGIPQAYIIAEEWLNNETSYLALGDNVLFGHDLPLILKRISQRNENIIFTQYVESPSHYGILEHNKDGSPLVVEKPSSPATNDAVIGLYRFDGDAANVAKKLVKSSRGEYEIADMINYYLENKDVYIEKLTRGIIWFDAGKVESLFDAATFVRSVQARQGSIICSPEEIAMRLGLVSHTNIAQLANRIPKSAYEQYVKKIAEEMLSN